MVNFQIFSNDVENRQYVSKLHVLTYSRQNMRNKEGENLTESISVIPAKYSPNVKLENIHNSRVSELG